MVSAQNRFASGGQDKTIRIWDLSKTESPCVETLHGHGGPVTCIVQLRDGRLLSGSEDTTLRVWDTSEEGWRPHMVGNQVAYNEKAIDGHTRAISGVCELSDGTVASSSWDGGVRLWKVDITASWEELYEPLPGRTVCELQRAPYGIMCTSFSSDNKIWRYDMNTSREEQPAPIRTKCLPGQRHEPWCVLQLRDSRVLVSSSDKDFVLWNFKTTEVVGRFKGHERGPVTAVIELPNRLLVSAGWDGKVILWSKPAL